MGLLASVAIRIGELPWLPRLLPQILWVDRWVQRLTRGRFALADLGGLPNLVLTVRGRRSGIARSTPLLCVPFGKSFLVAGSYFGGPKQPLWVANLEAAGVGELRFKGRTLEITARSLDGEERARVWPHMLQTWPNYALYERRTEREIKVFELTPR